MRKTKLYMDTVVDIQVIGGQSAAGAEAAINRAFEAFQKVEQACSRFSPDSELMQLCRQAGAPVAVSPFLFEPLKFALEAAKWTKGVYDPAVGKLMEEYGFNRHYLTGERMQSSFAEAGSYRNIVLNEQERTVYLEKPLVIDLGAAAKGFAIDLAAHELREFEGFVVNAGGDLYAGGVNLDGEPWNIDIQHPKHKEHIIYSVKLSNEAICTSGSYERRSSTAAGIHHLVHPAAKQSPNDWISCSVIAPFAMMADVFSTAAFILGVDKGKALIEQLELQGIFITPGLQIHKVGDV